jgi:hypothetical protein
MTRDPGFSCSHDDDPNPCPSQDVHDVRARLLAEEVGRWRVLVPQPVIVSARDQGHGIVRVEVYFSLDAGARTERLTLEQRHDLENQIMKKVLAMRFEYPVKKEDGDG